MPDRRGLTRTHRLLRELTAADGALRSRNFYWLASERDVIEPAMANWYMAPLSGFADFHARAKLPLASLGWSVSARSRRRTS